MKQNDTNITHEFFFAFQVLSYVITLRIGTLLSTTFNVLATTYYCLHMCSKHFLLTNSVKLAILF